MRTNPHEITHQVLAARGIGGHRQYRIPALAVSTRGTVLAAYDGRPNLDDLPNTIDLLVRRSLDHGRTWEPQQDVRVGTGLQGFGDPSLLVDRVTGRIFCFHAAGTHAGFFEAVEGLEPEDDVQHVDLSFSDDDGLTWSHRRVTASLKPQGVTGLFAAAGAGIQIETGPFAGRLVQQMVLLLRGEIRAASAYSDDHGDTWTLGEPTGPGANENKVVELSDGRMLLSSRAKGCRLQAVSTDGGRSYGPLHPVPDLPDPSDNGSVLRLGDATDDGAPLLATNNHDADLRRNTVLSVSRDEGASWRPALTICAGSSAYSTGAVLADGSLGVLYERDGYREIVFARVEPEALSPAALGEAVETFVDDDGGATSPWCCARSPRGAPRSGSAWARRTSSRPRAATGACTPGRRSVRGTTATRCSAHARPRTPTTAQPRRGCGPATSWRSPGVSGTRATSPSRPR